MIFSKRRERKLEQEGYEKIKIGVAEVFRTTTGKSFPGRISCNTEKYLRERGVKISQQDALATALKDDRIAKILAAWLADPNKKMLELGVGLHHSTERLVPPYKQVWPNRPDTLLYCLSLIGDEELAVTVDALNGELLDIQYAPRRIDYTDCIMGLHTAEYPNGRKSLVHNIEVAPPRYQFESF